MKWSTFYVPPCSSGGQQPSSTTSMLWWPSNDDDGDDDDGWCSPSVLLLECQTYVWWQQLRVGVKSPLRAVCAQQAANDTCLQRPVKCCVAVQSRLTSDQWLICEWCQAHAIVTVTGGETKTTTETACQSLLTRTHCLNCHSPSHLHTTIHVTLCTPGPY